MSRRQIVGVFALLVALGTVGLAFRLATSESELQLITGVEPLTEAAVDLIVIRDPEAAANADPGRGDTGEVFLWKVEDRWLVGTESSRFPTFSDRMQALLDTADQVHEAELVARNPINHPLMGVTDEIARTVEFWGEGKLLASFLVGDKQVVESDGTTLTPWTPANRSCFFRRAGEDDVYSVFCAAPEVFETARSSWSSPIIARAPSQEIESLLFTYPDEEFRMRPFGSVWVVQDAQNQEQAVEGQVRDVLRQLQPVAASGFPTDEELQGVDFERPDVTIRASVIADASVDPFTLLFVRKGEGPEHYVKVADSPFVYLFGEQESQELLKSRSDLLTTTLPTIAPQPAAP